MVFVIFRGFQRVGAAPERAKSVVTHHATPEQAGDVFTVSHRLEPTGLCLTTVSSGRG